MGFFQKMGDKWSGMPAYGKVSVYTALFGVGGLLAFCTHKGPSPEPARYSFLGSPLSDVHSEYCRELWDYTRKQPESSITRDLGPNGSVTLNVQGDSGVVNFRNYRLAPETIVNGSVIDRDLNGISSGDKANLRIDLPNGMSAEIKGEIKPISKHF
jgi:hypothetical protein